MDSIPLPMDIISHIRQYVSHPVADMVRNWHSGAHGELVNSRQVYAWKYLIETNYLQGSRVNNQFKKLKMKFYREKNNGLEERNWIALAFKLYNKLGNFDRFLQEELIPRELWWWDDLAGIWEIHEE